MGLFDIFRRHKKKPAEQPSAATSPASTAPESTQPSAPQEPVTSQASETAAQPTTASAQPTVAQESAATTEPEEPSAAPVSETPEETTPQATMAPEPATQPTEAAQSTEKVESSAAVQPTASEQSTTTSQPAEISQLTEPQPTAVSEEVKSESAATEEPVAESSASEAVVDSATSTATSSAAEQASEESVAESAIPTSEAVEEESSASANEPAEEPASEEAATEESAATADEDAEQANDEEEETDQTAKKYDRGLAKSRTGFGARLNRFLANFRHVDEDFFDDLEDMLIESDVGYDMAMKLSDELREEVKLENAKSKQVVSNVIIEKMVDLYDQAGKDENPDLNMAKSGPTVIMFVGVNGAGKTTTIGKMAALFKKQGKKVLLAAADTFRAGATEQLDVWAKRDGVDIVTGPENGDPAAVVFDAVQKAKKEDYDILFVDTAGRLQNKVNLMKELAKMKRILTREIPDAPHEVLLVLDATTGQNALNQAKLFKQSTDVTGIVLTKLDGTARGGIVLAIRNELHLPVKYVGLGEKVDDLQKFNASDFVYGLFKGLVDVD
ncbi:MAG: signal recognition particle-docking protein FtsY [Lactobacillaceae bacterium]|nr:signal recognition particle-docking protein FtsY [Limosilactobacillus sp.]MDD7692876.1 signal recognition particle-docking protein FtsY [Lactobacillaceae bacterium]MDY2802592.1 signal recognition particle-docking protein FtsY [Limosilactobacillus sp.]